MALLIGPSVIAWHLLDPYVPFNCISSLPPGWVLSAPFAATFLVLLAPATSCELIVLFEEDFLFIDGVIVAHSDGVQLAHLQTHLKFTSSICWIS